MSSFKKFYQCVFVLLVISGFTILANAASLTSSKGGYLKGETVSVSGEGFGRYERVSLEIVNYNSGLKQSVPVMNWEVVANAKGRFTAEFPFDSLAAVNGRFTMVATGLKSGTTGETTFGELILAANGDLDQCANGSFASPVPCTGANWQNGNVGQNNGHYYEGDTMPYRVKLSGLTVGSSNTLTLEWDTTKAGKHAIDYLTSYDRTESIGNDPCSGVVPACGAVNTFPIPLDPNVSGAGVTQVGGQVLTMWGGTITGISAYALQGTYAGDSSTSIVVTFTANQANPVLAFGGHIGSRQDWANQGGSASNINGSPYHMRLLDVNGSGGNQDRSLSNVAVRLNSSITIFVQASPESNQAFGFSTVGLLAPQTTDNLVPAAFSLVDDGVDNDATPNNTSFNNLLAPATSGSFSATLDTLGAYNLTGITCTQTGTSTFTTNVPLKTANINLVYGDSATCTFFVAVVTAANVSASGRVMDASGNGIGGTNVVIQNTMTGESVATRTNSFGNYTFNDLRAGDFYVVSVMNRKYTFEQSVQTLLLNDSAIDVNFIANEQ